MDHFADRLAAAARARGNAVCVATGGLATLIAPETRLIEHVDVDLTLHGLRIVWQRNHSETTRDYND